MLIPDQAVQPSRRGNNNVRTGIRVLDQVDVFLDRRATVKHSSPHFRHVLAESRVLVSDLEGEFTGMTEDKHRDFAVNRLNLLKRCKDKHCRFTEPGFGLAEDIGGENRLWETNLLDLGGVLETFSWGLVICLRKVK
jgi:hypothetical protein